MSTSEFIYLLASAVMACATAVVIMFGIAAVLELVIVYYAKSRGRAARLDGDRYFKDRELGKRL